MQLSVTQYAKERGISRQAVLQAIKKNHCLPGIESVQKVGATYVLRQSKHVANTVAKIN